jgi:hypothetical protein
MFTRIFIFINVLFYLICFPMSTFGENNRPKEALLYLDSVVANEYNFNTYLNLALKMGGLSSEKGMLFKSDGKDLKAFLKHESNHTNILIEWKDSKLNIPIKCDDCNIMWRPKHTGFMYNLFYESGGDVGTGSFHYVSLEYINGKIIYIDTEITSDEIYTDLGWSSDGKYYAFSSGASLMIKNIETGKVWATRSIVLNTKNEKIEISEDGANQLGGFLWIEGDKKIIVRWNHHPFDDEPAQAMIINIDQFNLD